MENFHSKEAQKSWLGRGWYEISGKVQEAPGDTFELGVIFLNLEFFFRTKVNNRLDILYLKTSFYWSLMATELAYKNILEKLFFFFRFTIYTVTFS